MRFEVGINVVHEDGHPHAGPSLTFEAKEYLHVSKRHTAERRGLAPIPARIEEQLLGVILRRLAKIPDIENRREALGGKCGMITHGFGFSFVSV
jgi:hypothetical protein